MRNVVVPERVSVKLHIDHLQELQLIVTKSSEAEGGGADVCHLQFLLQVFAGQCTFCPTIREIMHSQNKTKLMLRCQDLKKNN